MPRTVLFGLSAALSLVFAPLAAAADLPGLAGVHRVVFLGDSITYSGQYIEDVEAYATLRDPQFNVELLDLGLPSETVSGLSEPGHAAGKFPRPDVHERLDRVLEKTKPNLVVACYGMNCGIYHPFDAARFKKYQDGQRDLHQKAAAIGAKVLHVTPPTFDSVPIKARTLPAGLSEYRQPYVGYNDVLDRYSAWLVSKRADGWDIVDIHTPMNAYLAQQRKADPNFKLAGDGVHCDATGHWLIAREVLLHWGAPAEELAKAKSINDLLAPYPHGAEVLKLVQAKQKILKDAWLTATGHQRPGMKQGLPLEEADRQRDDLDAQIGKLVGRKPAGS